MIGILEVFGGPASVGQLVLAAELVLVLLLRDELPNMQFGEAWSIKRTGAMETSSLPSSCVSALRCLIVVDLCRG